MLTYTVAAAILALAVAQDSAKIMTSDKGLEFRMRKDQDAVFSRETTASIATLTEINQLENDVLREVAQHATEVYAGTVSSSADVEKDLIDRSIKVEEIVEELAVSLDDYVSIETFEKDLMDLKAKQQAEIDALVDEINSLTKRAPQYSDIQEFVGEEKKKMDSTSKTFKTDIEKDFKTKKDAMIAKFNEAKSEVSKRNSNKLPLWRGACKSYGGRGSMEKYCLSNTWENTAGQFIDVGANEFTAKVDGYYRINYMGIQESCNYGINELWVGNKRVWSGYSYQWGLWADVMVDQTWKIKNGEKFWIQANSRCSNKWGWHPGDSSGAHSVLQVMFVAYA